MPCAACASTSSGKCFSTDAIGTGTTWPRPQIDVSFSAWRQLVDRAPGRRRRAAPLRPRRSSMSASFCEPMRHGTHLPHDSLRKKRTALSAMSSMQARSSQTTIAPEPTRRAGRRHRVPVERQIEHRRRQVAAGRARRRERLERAARRRRRRRSSSISSRYVVPIGTSKTPGLHDVAADADELHARSTPFLPCGLHPVDAAARGSPARRRTSRRC